MRFHFKISEGLWGSASGSEAEGLIPVITGIGCGAIYCIFLSQKLYHFLEPFTGTNTKGAIHFICTWFMTGLVTFIVAAIYQVVIVIVGIILLGGLCYLGYQVSSFITREPAAKSQSVYSTRSKPHFDSIQLNLALSKEFARKNALVGNFGTNIAYEIIGEAQDNPVLASGKLFWGNNSLNIPEHTLTRLILKIFLVGNKDKIFSVTIDSNNLTNGCTIQCHNEVKIIAAP